MYLTYFIVIGLNLTAATNNERLVINNGALTIDRTLVIGNHDLVIGNFFPFT